jgi:hypothetical protein
LLIPRSAAFRTWLTTPQHGPVRLLQIPTNRRQPGENRSTMPRPGARSSQDPVRYYCRCALLSAERLILCATQPGRKTSRRRPRTLISNSPHLWAARMACPMRVARTYRKTPPRDRAANTAGSRSLAAGHCFHHRKCSVPSLLLFVSRGGPPSLGFLTGRIAVQHWARRALNRYLRARPIGACA